MKRASTGPMYYDDEEQGPSHADDESSRIEAMATVLRAAAGLS